MATRLKDLLRRGWHALRRLSGDDAYERYLVHHTDCHPNTPPLSCSEYFRHHEQEKWEGIRRCC